ncbi:MAG: hypothetical protein AAF892_04210, partial [Cyanobacteria bacterium P01_D01_bin.71]
MAELDESIRAWADKYHKAGGRPMVLQMAVGRQQENVGHQEKDIDVLDA